VLVNYVEKYILTGEVKFLVFLHVKSMALDQADAEIIKKKLLKYTQEG